METPQEYYQDEANWGNYQFITLKAFVDEVLVETTDPDSYLNNTPRSKIVTQAKIGIRNINREVKKTVLAVEMTVGPDMYLPLPQDYVDWVRVSVVTVDGKLKPLNVNVNINRAEAYLQDHLGEILFDDQGQILQSTGTNYLGRPYKKYAFTDYFRGKNFEINTSVLARWGEFVIDEQRGTIAFSSNLEGEQIVLEYISDGLQMYSLKEEQIIIHKDVVEALADWVYCECISKRRHVPANEKERARKRYKSTLHKCKIDSADFDMNQIFRMAGTATKQL